MSKRLNEIRKQSAEALAIVLLFAQKNGSGIPSELGTELVKEASSLYYKIMDKKRSLGHSKNNVWRKMWNRKERHVQPPVFSGNPLHTVKFRLEKIRKIAKLLGVSVSDIIALKSDMHEFIEVINTECKYTYYESGVVVKHGVSGENFGLFGHTAYKLNSLAGSDDEPEKRMFLSVPLLIGGKPVISYADEGSTGVLVKCQLTDRKTGIPKWHISFHPRGWLRKNELNLNNDEIVENMICEVEAGENVFTRKPAGWA